jgi:tetratricopeptide (TPR) repeat protein
LIQAKAYIERIFVLDPRSTEVPQARELQVQIEAEERRLELERLLARADVARCEKRLEEAIALYKEALDKYGPQADAEKALKATQAELEARLKAAEEARREVEAQRAKEEERERLAREQARVEAEAKREAAVQAEATDRRQEVKALLNQARLLREKGKLQEAAEAVQAAGRLDPDNPQVEAEARELRLAVAGQKLQEARGAKQAGRKGEALRLLNDAREWDPNNKVIEMELGLLRQSIAPGEADGMDTAELVWAPSRDMRFVITPPASPETEAGKVFLWGGVLDQKVDGAFIVKVGRDHQFCFTAGFPLKGVNFKAGVRVVGEYTGNQTFSTVLDAPVEVPCLKALYVE